MSNRIKQQHDDLSHPYVSRAHCRSCNNQSARRWASLHREQRREADQCYLERHPEYKERKRENYKRWAAENHEYVKIRRKQYYAENKETVLKRRKEWGQQLYRDAIAKVAAGNGDPIPRCRIDLTPNTSVSDLPCRGILSIDHINGGGRQEFRKSGSWKFYFGIARGKRGINDLRLLCRLHQLWNQI